MANFEQALAKTLAHEGGFVNDPDDPGGMTAFGISRVSFPDLCLWEMLDKHPEFVEKLKTFENFNELSSQTERFIWYDLVEKDVRGTYYHDFWQPIHGDEIESQEIAEYLFDFAVNSGVSDAVKALQWGCNEILLTLEVDGVLGDKTINRMNSIRTNGYIWELQAHLRTYRAIHYLKAIAANHKLAKFAGGWAGRV